MWLDKKMVEGKRYIRLGGSLFFFILIIVVILRYFIPENSIFFTIGLFICLILFFSFIPLIMYGLLKIAYEKDSAFLIKSIYFWPSLIGIIILGVLFLIVAFWALISLKSIGFILPLYFSIIYLLFALLLIRFRKMKKKET